MKDPLLTYVVIVLVRDAGRVAGALVRADECLDAATRFRAVAARGTSIILRCLADGSQWDFNL